MFVELLYSPLGFRNSHGRGKRKESCTEIYFMIMPFVSKKSVELRQARAYTTLRCKIVRVARSRWKSCKLRSGKVVNSQTAV